MRWLWCLFSLATIASGSFAWAQSACKTEWTVQSARTDQDLHLKIRETSAVGPACDLVVKHFDYLDGAAILNLELAPVKECPLDAIAPRRASLSWQLPHELRASGALKLIVNGSIVGILSVGLDRVGFKGGCQ